MQSVTKTVGRPMFEVPSFSFNFQQLTFASMVAAAFAAASALSIVYSDEAAWVPFLPLFAIALVFVAWMMKRAIEGSRGAVIGYLVLLVFITDAQFRARGAGEIDTD